MKNELLITLRDLLHTRAEVVQAIGVMREFLTKSFFALGEQSVEYEKVIGLYKKEGSDVSDVRVLEMLPRDIWHQFKKDSFNDVLDMVLQELDTVPTLPITVPISFNVQQLSALSEWVRSEIKSEILLDVTVDPEIIAGCRFVWNNTLHDFSLHRYIRDNHESLQNTVVDILNKQSEAREKTNT